MVHSPSGVRYIPVLVCSSYRQLVKQAHSPRLNVSTSEEHIEVKQHDYLLLWRNEDTMLRRPSVLDLNPYGHGR